MKTIRKSIVPFTILATILMAGTTFAESHPVKNKKTAEANCCPTASSASNVSNWVASPFMSYLDPQGSGKQNNGIGGGILVEKYLNPHVGVGASLESNSGPDNQFAALASATYRYPVSSLIAPYLTVAVGYQALDENSALLRTGAGVQFDISNSYNLFSDWQYGWSSNGEEQQVIRAGVGFKF